MAALKLHQPKLEMTIIVSQLELKVKVIFHSFIMTHFGMESNVIIWNLSAVLHQTCRGLSNFLITRPLTILN